MDSFLFPTDRGSMPADQLVYGLEYSCYRYNRHDLGMAPERLARVFGEVKGADFERMYREEQRNA